ncbi:MAG: PadR family transcriptional regulator [Maribacter sp.]|nr:PadR family transcriptional regulator [Maribacter sp.]
MDLIKITSLDYAILGLIHQKSQSGYGIRKQFETTALGNYSSSPGAIYPALKRLQKSGLVIQTKVEGSTKTRFDYTSKGQNALKNWFLKPITIEDVAKKSEELLLRFAFMDKLLNKKQTLKFLQSFRDSLKIYIVELDAFHSREKNDLPLHGRLAFEHGLSSARATLKWCKMAITTINQSKKT